MRDTIVVIVIVSSIIIGSFWTFNFYESTKNEFEEKLEILVQTIDTEENKEEIIEEIEKLWKNKEGVLIVFEEHDAIDDIEDKLYECFHYYRINEKDQLELSKVGVLKGMEDLTKREKLTLVNIF